MRASQRPDLRLYHAVTAPAKGIRVCQGPCGVYRKEGFCVQPTCTHYEQPERLLVIPFRPLRNPAHLAGPQARAGVGPKDIQVAQFYENFTGLALIAMCEMGVAAPDEIEEWLLAGNARWPDGELPINTSGGNLAEAYVHGFELINEAARQVRGESTCQVHDVQFSLVVSGPGALPASAALLSVEP